MSQRAPRRELFQTEDSRTYRIDTAGLPSISHTDAGGVALGAAPNTVKLAPGAPVRDDAGSSQVCWIADRIHLPPRLRRNVQTSVASVRLRSLPSTIAPSARRRVASSMLKRMATVA